MKMVRSISFLLAAVLMMGSGLRTSFAAASDAEPKLIALTFDDGPNTHTTPEVLDLLEEYDAHASFFLIGDKINEESAAVAKRAYDMGCEINSHSKTHSDMSVMDAEEIRAEMEYVDEWIYSITGEYPKFFRPPYLNVSPTMYDAIEIPFITGLSSGDSGSEATAQTVTENVLSNARDGAIILMHDFWGNDKTVEALQTILPELQSQGYEFVTLTELFERQGETPLHGVCYREVLEHPCGGYSVSQTLYKGMASGDSSWEGWNTETMLDGEVLAAQDSFTIEVAYEGDYPPVMILNRWKSSEDNFWERIQPAYYNGRKACFRSEDLQAVLDRYGVEFTDVNKIMIRSPWSQLTVTQADLLVKSAEAALMGDVTLDGVFNVTDVIALQKWLLAVPNCTLECWENGDFCADRTLNGFDLAMMKRSLLTGGNT